MLRAIGILLVTLVAAIALYIRTDGGDSLDGPETTLSDEIAAQAEYLGQDIEQLEREVQALETE
jgi:hypothetical protein